jgi:hypothetical protein
MKAISIVVMLLILTPFVFNAIVNVKPVAAAVADVDFVQCANEDPTLGECHWIVSIVQQSNSVYYEGMSVMQRLILNGIGDTAGHVHTLTFKVEAAKDQVHAYDFLTSWDQAKAAADEIDTGLLPTVTNTIYPTGMTCAPNDSLEGVCNALVVTSPVKADFPDALDGLLSDDVAFAILHYESAFGNRQIEIFGNQPISFPSVTFDGYEMGHDTYADYTLTWTSTSTSILIRFAGHLACGTAQGNCPGGADVAYPAGKGASSISGGPYHFKLDQLDDSSLGSQDNQIKGADILIPPPPGGLTIAKQTVGGVGAFDYTGTDESGDASTAPDITNGFTLTTTSPSNYDSESFAVNFNPGAVNPYHILVTESSLPSTHWALTNIVCTGTGSATTDKVAKTAEITIDPEETESCVFVNTLLGTITVAKETLPSGSPGSFDFTAVAPVGYTPLSPGTFSLEDKGTRSYSDLLPGMYNATETNLPEGFALTSITCNDGSSSTPSEVDLGSLKAIFHLDAGETVTCTFKNSAPEVPEYPLGIALLVVALTGIYVVMRRKVPD